MYIGHQSDSCPVETLSYCTTGAFDAEAQMVAGAVEVSSTHVCPSSPILNMNGNPVQYLAIAPRRELQHMLFSRRKAEIEVLGAVRASRDADPVLGRDRPAVGGQAGIPLVRYLVAKICAACADPDHELL